eukprot:GHRQ01032580.1.p1 GENE.GHRQ01032580.1~~GHRQ01032580.1.p1  ORF type:complete len:115 (-),score=11.55 GHRQ01032580.1:400-744(-)
MCCFTPAKPRYNACVQIPFDSTVRISMDTNLCMIKENPDEGPSCTLAGRWYRCVMLYCYFGTSGTFSFSCGLWALLLPARHFTCESPVLSRPGNHTDAALQLSAGCVVYCCVAH